MVQNEALPVLFFHDPCVQASILASGPADGLILVPPYTPSYGGRANEFRMKGPNR